MPPKNDSASTENPLAKYAEPDVREVRVGAETLVLERLSIHRHRAFWKAAQKIDLAPFGESLGKLFSGRMEVAAGLASEVIAAFGDDSGAMAEALFAALDTEQNYGRLGIEAPAARSGKLYVRSDELRERIEHSCEFPQAMIVLQQALEMNAYTDLGKALLRTLRAAIATGAAMAQTQTAGSGEILG